jgi:hypothetical protein
LGEANSLREKSDRSEETEMSKLKLRRPSPGTILGTIALVVAVAGNANAFSSSRVIVRRGDIAKGAVTAKALASGAVHAKALAKGAVTAKALHKEAVMAAALGRDAVTAAALAPGSVYGGALGGVTVHSSLLSDTDAVAENGMWSVSSAEVALCGSGERLLSGGIVFTSSGNHEIGVITSQPFVNGGSNGWVGAITSNSGGTAKGEVQALCLQ